MSAAAIRAGRAYIEFFTIINPHKAGLLKTQTLVRNAAKKMCGAGIGFLASIAQLNDKTSAVFLAAVFV